MKVLRLIAVFFLSAVIVCSITGCAEEIEKPKDNLQIASEAAEANKTPENYLALSLMYYRAGQFENCIEAARKALSLKPDYAAAYNNICSAYNEQKMWDKGIEACKHALELDPEFQLAKNNLNWALSQMKKEQKKDTPHK